MDRNKDFEDPVTLVTLIPAALMGLGAMATGAYLGYQRAGYHTFDDPLTGTLLKFLPAAIGSVVCGAANGLCSLVDSLRGKNKKGLRNALESSLIETAKGAILGGAVGGIGTYIGYRMGTL
ncbi:MAG: hypothetical protein AABX10_01815 [Nanoarchaeota archaeon]